MEINKMDHRDILGFSKKQPKKKAEENIAPKPTVPPVTELLKKEFGQLNEWTSKPPTEKRWSGAYTAKDGLTEFERKGGKDNVNEGPAYEYGDQISKIDKLYDVYWDAVKDLGRTLEKKGLRKEAKQLYLTYRKQVSKFSQWFSKFSGGLM
jgi:hypothetical protein